MHRARDSAEVVAADVDIGAPPCIRVRVAHHPLGHNLRPSLAIGRPRLARAPCAGPEPGHHRDHRLGDPQGVRHNRGRHPAVEIVRGDTDVHRRRRASLYRTRRELTTLRHEEAEDALEHLRGHAGEPRNREGLRSIGVRHIANPRLSALVSTPPPVPSRGPAPAPGAGATAPLHRRPSCGGASALQPAVECLRRQPPGIRSQWPRQPPLPTHKLCGHAFFTVGDELAPFNAS